MLVSSCLSSNHVTRPFPSNYSIKDALKAWDGRVSCFHGYHELGSFDFDGFLAAVLILFFKADDDTILYLGGAAYAQLYVFLMADIKP